MYSHISTLFLQIKKERSSTLKVIIQIIAFFTFEVMLCFNRNFELMNCTTRIDQTCLQTT